jgi:hypothetical protein
MTFTLDSLLPDRLRCDQCGQLFGPADIVGEDLAALVSLTQEQAAHRWPDLAADLDAHEYACPRQAGPTVQECERFTR